MIKESTYVSATIMLINSHLIIIISIVQTADWIYGATKTENQPAYVKDAALANMVICIVGLIGYTIYSVSDFVFHFV